MPSPTNCRDIFRTAYKHKGWLSVRICKCTHNTEEVNKTYLSHTLLVKNNSYAECAPHLASFQSSDE